MFFNPSDNVYYQVECLLHNIKMKNVINFIPHINNKLDIQSREITL